MITSKNIRMRISKEGYRISIPLIYLFLTSSFNCSVSSRSVFCEGKGEDVFSGLCAGLWTFAALNLVVAAEDGPTKGD